MLRDEESWCQINAAVINSLVVVPHPEVLGECVKCEREKKEKRTEVEQSDRLRTRFSGLRNKLTIYKQWADLAASPQSP